MDTIRITRSPTSHPEQSVKIKATL